MKAYNCVIRVIEALRTSNIFSENWDMNKKNVNVSCLHTNTNYRGIKCVLIKHKL